MHALGTHPAPAAPCARAHTRAHSDARLVDLVGAPVGEGVDHPAIIMAKLLDVEACCDTWLPTLIKQRIRMRPAQSDKNEILPSRDQSSATRDLSRFLLEQFLILRRERLHFL